MVKYHQVAVDMGGGNQFLLITEFCYESAVRYIVHLKLPGHGSACEGLHVGHISNLPDANPTLHRQFCRSGLPGMHEDLPVLCSTEGVCVCVCKWRYVIQGGEMERGENEWNLRIPHHNIVIK